MGAMLRMVIAALPRFSWWWLLVVGCGAVFVGHLVDVHRHEKRAFVAGQAEVQGRWTAAELVRAAVAAKAEVAARAEEQRRTAAMTEIANETQRMAARDRAAAASVDAASGGLRDAVAGAITGGGLRPRDSATAAFGPASAASSVLFSDVLGPAEERLRALAAEADTARTAGEACERAYDSLTTAGQR